MKFLPSIILLFIGGIVMGMVLSRPVPEPAGDIAEYFGITETVMRHGSLDLQPRDQASLSELLHPEYFVNPGYYIEGIDGNRYPVHFVAYSLLLVPMRWVLELAGTDPLAVFGVANTLILFCALYYCVKRFGHTVSNRFALIILTLASPLIFFLNWPGPDLLVLSLALIGFLYWRDRKPFTASILFAFASWHSQPLVVLAAGALGYGLFHTSDTPEKTRLTPGKTFATIAILTLLPYALNMVLFGTWSPWTVLDDGWTKLYGFGVHNIRVSKLMEQLFDLNIGVFWYAPILTLMGVYALFLGLKRPVGIWVTLTTLATLFAFQTNPAWHYGTAGFAPSRHAIILVPFFIVILNGLVSKTRWGMVIVLLILLTQSFILSINNYIFPIFTNTLVHSPMASYVLNRWPGLYTPTPEIFVDRTNHTDLDYPTSAIYRYAGACRKAYVLPRDIDMTEQTCGPFPKTIRASIVNPDTDGFYVTYD